MIAVCKAIALLGYTAAFALPPLQSPQGLTDPSLAYGVAGLVDWTTTPIYLDIARIMRQWSADGDDGFKMNYDELKNAGHLDNFGWVMSLPAGADRVTTIWHWHTSGLEDSAAVDRAGRYILTYDGAGDIRVWGDVTTVSSEPGRIEFDNRSGGYISMGIYDPDSTGTGDYIRNISIIKEEDLPLAKAGAVFDPKYRAVIDDARHLRFMDVMQTNGSTIADWDGYAAADDALWKPMPVALMVRLANETGADPWFCMPHKADNTFIRNFAGYVHDHLDPGLKAHVELSNECWNWGFQQTHDLVAQGQTEWDNGQVGAYYIKRATEVMQIWDDVYGGEADARLVKILAGQAVNTWLSETVLLNGTIWKNNEPAAWVDPAETFDAFALTSYFGGRTATNDSIMDLLLATAATSEEAAFDDLYRKLTDSTYSSSIPYVFARLAEQKALVQPMGLDLILYEGGQHEHHFAGGATNDTLINNFMTDFVRSPQMVELYRQLWAGWEAIGDGPFMHFVDFGPPSKYGSWGLRATYQDTPARALLLDSLNAATPAWWESRGGTHFQQGVIEYGDSLNNILTGTIQEDYLIGRAGNDALYPGPEDDGINGGDGTDTLLLSGVPPHYTVHDTSEGIHIEGPDGTDYCYSVEMFRFADGTVLDLAGLKAAAGVRPRFNEAQISPWLPNPQRCGVRITVPGAAGPVILYDRAGRTVPDNRPLVPGIYYIEYGRTVDKVMVVR